MRVLLIEDDERIGSAVREQVSDVGHAVDWVLTLADARAYYQSVSYDLLLLDLSLPDGHGLDFLRQFRRHHADSGILILTAHDRLSDRIDGLDAGADDYLVKPFDLEELTARIRAVARRRNIVASEPVTVGGLMIDTTARQVSRDGETINLTAREWALLERLLRRSGAIVSKGELEQSLYDFDREVDVNAIEALVSRLRKKLGQPAIVTVRGLGYRLNTAP